MENMQNVVIAAAKRTPVGAFQGSISSVSGPDLGAKVIGGILEETMLDPTSVNEVIMGNVLAAGITTFCIFSISINYKLQYRINDLSRRGNSRK